MSNKLTVSTILILVIVATIAWLAFSLFNFQSGAALVNAVADGNTELIVELLEEGHDIDSFGKDDWTPLTAAVENDDSAMVRFLLQSGANPNRIVPGGTALDMALRRERSEPARLLREFGGYCKTACDLDRKR